MPGTEDTDASDAVALFADRAAAVVPGFELVGDNRAAVIRICRRLEGIPLAIELAVVRLRVLSVDQLVRRLDDRFGLLTVRPRAAVALHRWRAGEYGEAADLLVEAIALRLTDRSLLAFLLEALAWCRSSDGEHDQATRLLGGAAKVWRLSGARVGEMNPYESFDEQCATRARAEFGTAAFDAAFAEAAGLDLDGVVRRTSW